MNRMADTTMEVAQQEIDRLHDECKTQKGNFLLERGALDLAVKWIERRPCRCYERQEIDPEFKCERCRILKRIERRRA